MRNNIDSSREDLELFQNEVLRRMLNSGALSEMPIVNEVDLILEAKLSGDNVLKFNLVSGNNDRPCEFKITKNDIFSMSHGLIGVVKYTKTESDKEYAISPVLTYADKSVLKGVKGGVKEFEVMRNVWDGMLSFRTSRTERLADFHTRNFLFAPERQLSEGVEPSYGLDHAGRGFYKYSQSHILCGSSTNKIELALPEMADRLLMIGNYDAAGADTTNYNVVRLHLKGHVAIDAANAYENWLKKA